MKHVLYGLAVAASLVLLVGSVATPTLISFVGSQSHNEQNTASYQQSLPQASSDEDENMPVPTPIFINDLPDSQYIPIHPDAVEIETSDESGVPGEISYSIGYRVPIRIYFVEEFYKKVLAQSGWSPKATGSSVEIYTRAVSDGSLSWHMYLELSANGTLSGEGTLVGLRYGRYPEGEADMPVYPNAQQVAVSHHEEPSNDPLVVSSVRVTLKTYLTSASPDELEDFYNANLEQYGWVSYAAALTRGDKNKKVSITSEAGLYFAAAPPFTVRLASGELTVTTIALHIKAKTQQDGQTKVELRMEESESTMGRW